MYFLAGRRRLVFVITFLLVWLVGASSVAADAAPELMKATVLDRSSLRLAGQWGIVPNQFLKPASWRELRTAIKGTVSVPGDWTGHALSGGEALTAQGFGTLLVQVSVAPDAALGLQMNSGSRAYQVMLLSAEGRVLGEMSLGSVAQSKDNEAPASWYSDILSFQSGEADESRSRFLSITVIFFMEPVVSPRHQSWAQSGCSNQTLDAPRLGVRLSLGCFSLSDSIISFFLFSVWKEECPLSSRSGFGVGVTRVRDEWFSRPRSRLRCDAVFHPDYLGVLNIAWLYYDRVTLSRIARFGALV